ncbi:hypothetical protein AeNC1_009974 [Aphanomyces euteiches]|nr:hypothetical protein AeNC1_009974 [Aphanomyces euteiches]
MLVASPVAPPPWNPSRSSRGLKTFVLLDKTRSSMTTTTTLYASYKAVLTQTPLHFDLLARVDPLQSNGACSTNNRRRRQDGSTRQDEVAASVFEVAFAFLDVDELSACVLVSKSTKTIATSAHLWLAIYNRAWRANGQTLPRPWMQLTYHQLVVLVQSRLHLSRLELSTRGRVLELPRGLVQVANTSVMRTFANGAVESIRGKTPLPLASCGLALGVDVAYYEVAMKSSGSVGLAMLTSRDYGYAKESHVGSRAGSIGFHGFDGGLYEHLGASSGHESDGKLVNQGPTWANNCTLGCGIVHGSMSTVFFTLNGELVASTSVEHPLVRQLALAVSLEAFGDECVVNLGTAPFVFDLEAYCLSLSSSPLSN